MLIKKFFIIFLILFSISSHAKDIGIVKNIQFKGLKNVSQNEALKSTTLNKKNIISTYDIQNSIKSLFATGKFKNIQVVYSKKNIIFYVEEKPIIAHVFFLGNSIIKNSILDSYLRKLNITKGRVFNEFIIDKFIKTLTNFYYDSGNFESNVQIFKEFSHNNTVSLKISINEGVKRSINSIKIVGAKNFSIKKLTSLFQLKEYNILSNPFNTFLYSPKQLKKDLKNLNDFYLNHGYFYFHINDYKVDFVKGKNEVNIKIDISEGKKYYISKIFVKGHFSPYQVLIKKLITIKFHDTYNKEKIHNIIDNIRRFLSDHGYINAVIKIRPKINNTNNTIDLNFYIDINKRFFVHKIHFIGNAITKDKVLRREIQQMEGKYIDTHLIELGKKALQKTKYFSDVEVIKKIYSVDSSQVDIFYKVKEQPTGSINFGLGYGIDNGISFNASLSKDNIFGSGNSFKAKIIKNDNQKYADISISYPYFIYNIKDLKTRFFYNNFKYNFNNNVNSIKTTYGLESVLGFLINSFDTVHFGFGYTHNGVDNQEKLVDADHLKTTSIDSKFLDTKIVDDFTLNYSWVHSTLEYLYFPISGNQTYISGKNTIPGSDNNFYKFILDSENYLPLNKKQDVIFLSHVHWGIGNIFNSEQFPFYENFYANSESNVRGFRLNTIGPKKIYNTDNLKDCAGYINNNKCESTDSIGGNVAFTTNLEIISPISFIDSQYSKYLRASIFLDAGNIWKTDVYNDKKNQVFSFLEHNILHDLYSSIGVSLKWFSPVGPIIFSYALPIQKDKNYQLEPFQFHFGKNW